MVRDYQYFEKYRVPILVLASLQTFAAAGIFYGWSAMNELLINEGAFKHLCSPGEHLPCDAQLAKLHLVYTVGQFANLCAPLVVGVFLDFAGPRLCAVVCLAFVAAGVVLLGLASEAFQTYFPALVMIAVGGPGIQTASFFAMNLFPNHANSVSSLVSGVFQLGFVVFLAMKFVADSTTLSFKAICFIYGVFLVLMAAASIVLFPSSQLSSTVIVSAEKIVSDEEENLIQHGDDSASSEPDEPEVELMKTKETWNGQLFSMPFLLISAWMTVQVFWANTYIGTVGSQVAFIDRNADVSKFVSIFNLFLPAGVLIIPFYGRFMDKVGYPAGFAMASIASLIYAICYCIQDLNVQYISFISYALSRTCVFAAFFSYVAHEFGYKFFGTITGGSFLMMSIFSLLQYPMTQAISNFQVLGCFQLASYASCALYSVYVQVRLNSPLPWRKQVASSITNTLEDGYNALPEKDLNNKSNNLSDNPGVHGA